MKKFCLVVLFQIVLAVPANAGFGRWSYKMESDPFSGGVRVTVDIVTSIQSAIYIWCDSAQTGASIRVVPGYAYTADMAGFVSLLEIAIDGKKITAQTGGVVSVGANFAAIDVVLDTAKANRFIDSFAGAKKQIAIKDGLTDKPHLLTGKGSAKAGVALMACMLKQAH